MSFCVAALYQFLPLPDFRALRAPLRARCEQLQVKGTLLLAAWAVLRGRPQDLPWTPLDLGEPVGLFTGAKLAALGDHPAQCRALLARAGVTGVVDDDD